MMKKGDPPQRVDVDIRKVQLLGLLVTDADDGIDYDHADWCDAKLEFGSLRPMKDLTVRPPAPAKYVLTPEAPDKPRINGARVFGVRPGHPFLYTIAATGRRPMSFAVKNLPRGLTVDSSSGRITGTLEKRATIQ